MRGIQSRHPIEAQWDVTCEGQPVLVSTEMNCVIDNLTVSACNSNAVSDLWHLY